MKTYSLDTIVGGFTDIRSKLPYPSAAISFAFPSPAEYPLGFIGDRQHLPAFREGIGLGPMLHEKSHLPVFINDDGDLLAYGEALAGFLPHIRVSILVHSPLLYMRWTKSHIHHAKWTIEKTIS